MNLIFNLKVHSMISLKSFLGIALATATLGGGVAAGVSAAQFSEKNAEVAEASYGTNGKITIYFAGVSSFDDMKEVKIAVNNSWGTASATSGTIDQHFGQYKYQYTTNSNQTALNAYFVNTSNQYRHPACNAWDTEYSTIDKGSISTLQPGHSYIITFTSWERNYDNWEHAWFNYTFVEADSASSSTNSFYVYDPHSILGSLENVNVYGFGCAANIAPMEWPGVHTGITQTTLGRASMFAVALSTSYPSFIMNNGTNQTGNVTDLASNIGNVLVIDETKTGNDYNTHWDSPDIYLDAPATDGYYLLGNSNFMAAVGTTGNEWKFNSAVKMNSLSGEGNKANYVLTVDRTVIFRVRSYFNISAAWLNFGTTYDGTDGITTTGDNVQLAQGTYSIYVNESSAVYIAKGLPLDAFCSTFLTDINTVCDAETGNTNLTSLKSTWTSLSSLYGELTADAKAEIVAIGFNGGSDVDDAHKVVKAYKYIVTKYGTANCPDFIWGATISPASSSHFRTSSNGSSGIVLVVTIASVISLISIGAFFLLKKKKHQ